MLQEECYIITARRGDLPFDAIEARLRSSPEVREVPTRPEGTYLMKGTADAADIVLEMTHRNAKRLPACALYLIVDRPDCLVLDTEGADEGSRKVLVRFLEWLSERCPFSVHDNQGRYADEIDEKGLSAFLFEPWE